VSYDDINLITTINVLMYKKRKCCKNFQNSRHRLCLQFATWKLTALSAKIITTLHRRPESLLYMRCFNLSIDNNHIFVIHDYNLSIHQRTSTGVESRLTIICRHCEAQFFEVVNLDSSWWLNGSHTLFVSVLIPLLHDSALSSQWESESVKGPDL